MGRLLKKGFAPVILSGAKDLGITFEEIQGCFAEFTLSSFASLRTVRQRRANGLSMTIWRFLAPCQAI